MTNPELQAEITRLQKQLQSAAEVNNLQREQIAQLKDTLRRYDPDIDFSPLLLRAA